MNFFNFLLSWFSYQISYFKHKFKIRAINKKFGLAPKRSSRWPSVEHAHRAANPDCAVCGGTYRINVHHIIPFHVDHTLELEPSNLITLCMSFKQCHLHIGHGGSFIHYNPSVKTDAAKIMNDPIAFDVISAEIKARRL